MKKFNFKIPIYIDNMNNTFKKTFSSWPFRAIIFKNNEIVYNSELKNSQFNIVELYNFLKDL